MTPLDTFGLGALASVAIGIASTLWGIGQHRARVRADAEVRRLKSWRDFYQTANKLSAQLAANSARERSARASHARQCQIQQQRAAVLAKAAEMRGEG